MYSQNALIFWINLFLLLGHFLGQTLVHIALSMILLILLFLLCLPILFLLKRLTYHIILTIRKRFLYIGDCSVIA